MLPRHVTHGAEGCKGFVEMGGEGSSNALERRRILGQPTHNYTISSSAWITPLLPPSCPLPSLGRNLTAMLTIVMKTVGRWRDGTVATVPLR